MTPAPVSRSRSQCDFADSDYDSDSDRHRLRLRPTPTPMQTPTSQSWTANYQFPATTVLTTLGPFYIAGTFTLGSVGGMETNFLHNRHQQTLPEPGYLAASMKLAFKSY